jgi:ATP-binding cassette subfamily F protein uup
MGILTSIQSISKTYSSRPLFREISFAIEEDEKLGMIGPNGSGKSTLLKIIAGLVDPDDGSIVSRKQLRVAYVPQEETFEAVETVEAIVRAAAEQAEFQPHERDASIDSTLTAFRFPDRNALAGSLSGGWRKRLALACGLVQQPELLMLDEPTNHLDLEGILWLEDLLRNARYSLVLVTHDRAFLESVTNRTVELNPTYPQGFISVKGNYSDFLVAREEQLSQQMNLQQALASKVRREVAWLQRGARARQTKSRGRIQEAAKLMDDLAELKQRNAVSSATAEIGFDASGRRAKELLSLKGVHKAFGDRKLISDLSFILTPGAKLGLVGRNGSGKTTLLKMIVDQIQPDKGAIKRAADLKIVWFDQSRAQLDTTKTLRDSLSPTGDSVIYRGRQLHVTTWAKKFLFKQDQLNLPISYLSGGEQARILIANLMLQPADILILDEPTNDLDIPSLEALEESLEDFPGAVILVTHDRMMMDTVSNVILGLDGHGGNDFYADYEQCERALQRFAAPEQDKKLKLADKKSVREKSRMEMSTSEKRELASMPEKIEKAEAKLAELHKETEKPHNASNYAKLQDLVSQQEAAQKQLEELFSRWQELEAKSTETSDSQR